MALQQEHFVSQNVYDKEQRKTEDMYETLQIPPTVVSRKASGKKIMVPLLIINILLLTSILLITGIHYYHFRQSGEEVLNDQKTNQEMWYLHDDAFYLFWSNHSDCRTANRFCNERSAKLATVTGSNKQWLESQINGKRLLVDKMSSPVDGDMRYMNGQPNCMIFSETSSHSEQVEGWVCQKEVNIVKYADSAYSIP